LALVNSDTAGIVSLNYYYKLERRLGTSNRQFFDLIYKRHNNSKGQLTLTFFDMSKFDRSKFFVRHSTVQTSHVRCNLQRSRTFCAVLRCGVDGPLDSYEQRTAGQVHYLLIVE
jgi:hypothetical protein